MGPSIASTMAGHVSLAYRGLSELPRDSVAKLEEVHHLDLSHNEFSDLRSLYGLSNLTTLILDNNKLGSHTVFPPMPNLQILWVNKNQITNLSIFIETVASSFPDLRHLSMLNNAAAPSYFNGGSKQEYEDYRHYVTSHLPKLRYLDDKGINQDERESAHRIYGRRRVGGTTGGRRDIPANRKRRSQSMHTSTKHNGE